jgi:hypothetical protein
MSTPMEPLTPEVVDELLSAELDGDFDAAARDHGYAPAIARELLAGEPNTDERRATLAAARDAMAVEPLPPAERARLLAAASAAGVPDATAAGRARNHRYGRVAAIAAIAAALAFVVGAGAMLTTRDDHSKDTSSAASARKAGDSGAGTSASKSAGESAASAAPTFDFGTAPDDQQLRARIEAALPSATADSTLTAPAPQFRGEQGGRALVVPRDDCVRAQAEAIGLAGPVLLRGPVVYKGSAADVYLFADGNATVALVIDDAGAACRLLSSQLLRSGS